MIYNRICKNVFKSGLVALLSVAAFLMGCSSEEDNGERGDSFFRIRVATDGFGTVVPESRAVTGRTQPDTIITPIDDELYMETIYSKDDASEEMTRSSLTPENVKNGTQVTVFAYLNNKYVGKIEGTVGENGHVTMTDNSLLVAPGTYSFVCMANVTIDSSGTFFYAEKGRNSMSAKLENVVINEGDRVCNLNFQLKHRVGQIRVSVSSESGPFTGLSASLKSNNGATCPLRQKITLPDNASQSQEQMVELDDPFFINVTGTEATSGDEQYYIAGYDYSQRCGIYLDITQGVIGGVDIAGNKVSFNNFDVQPNSISKVKIRFIDNIFQNITISADPTSVTLARESGSSDSSIITTNDVSGWVASIPADCNWLQLTKANGMSGEKVSFATISENTTDAVRSTVITVASKRNPAKTVKITVYQINNHSSGDVIIGTRQLTGPWGTAVGLIDKYNSAVGSPWVTWNYPNGINNPLKDDDGNTAKPFVGCKGYSELPDESDVGKWRIPTWLEIKSIQAYYAGSLWAAENEGAGAIYGKGGTSTSIGATKTSRARSLSYRCVRNKE